MSDFKGLFQLQTRDDLPRKLEYDFKRIEESPLDPYAAFDFFVAAFHLKEWPGQSQFSDVTDSPRDRALMRTCAHIANGVKHFQIDRNSVAATSIRPGAFDPEAFQNNAFDVGALVFELGAKEADAIGSTQIEAPILAKAVLEYWQKRLRSP